jgi:shikimate dehydrogenase
MPGFARTRSGMTKHYAVLGSPISHSKSPIIHSAAFKFQGVAADYRAIEVTDGLGEFIASQTDGYQGFSITMPLKEQALDFADRADSLAIATGAANTLIRTETGWDAYNTDVFGIQQAVSAIRFKSVAVIGTGATARSAIVAMQQLDKQVSIWGRSAQSIKQLAAEFEVSTQSLFHKACEADLVISTLPPQALDEYLPTLKAQPRGILLDVAYDPWPSQAANLWGAERTISGIEMLLWQALGQQRLFAGNDLDEPLSREKELLSAIRDALNMAK